MHRSARHYCLSAIALSSVIAGHAGADTAITIYSKAQPGAVDADLYRPVAGDAYRAAAVPGYALVRQDQSVDIDKGRSEVRLTDVAALIDPTTVRFESLTDPDGTRVLEQDFRFDLVGTQKLMNRYIDETIRVDQVIGDRSISIEGTLLSTDGGLVVQQADGSVQVLTEWQNVTLGALPGGLMTRPTLVWDVLSDRGGKHDTRLSYETKGATWWADYNLVWHPQGKGDKGTLSVGAWVSILNQSGASYQDAKLKLIAGDVQRAQPQAFPRVEALAMRSRAAPVESDGFAEKALFEFHMYTLDRPTTIPDNSTKQIELFAQVAGVPATKRLIYSPSGSILFDGRRRYLGNGGDKVNAFIEFTNNKKNGLGIPLPAGRVRVSQQDDGDGSLEFIGEDVIEHTPRNETLRVRLGSAFDVLGARSVIEQNRDGNRRMHEETVELTITNRKDVAQPVSVFEQMQGHGSWQILDASEAYSKHDATQIGFEIVVPADSEKTIRYRVRYTW